MLKKLSVVFLVVCLPFIFGGCCEHVDYYHGQPIENFRPYVSEYSVVSRLAPLIEIIPAEGPRRDDVSLIYDYDYVEGMWFWGNDAEFLLTDMDRALMYIVFTEDSYQQAKYSIFDWYNPDPKVDFSTKSTYNGYTFYKSYFDGYYDEFSGGTYTYTMAGYNNDKNMLIFVSMYCVIDYHPELDTALNDFGFYLKTFYGDFYNFDE